MKPLLLLFSVLAFYPLYAQHQVMPQTLNDERLAEAKAYLTGIGKPKDKAKAFSIYSEIAAAGDPKAMNALGIIYKEGIGVKVDKSQAIDWLIKAGKAGYAESWYNLGLIYKDATSKKERDFEKAYTYFSLAADMKDPQSVYAKAYMLYKGLGCAQNYGQSARLFAQGARLGRPNSMYFYGLCFRNGYGVEENTDSARYWLTQAALKGYRMAVTELATPTSENSDKQARALAISVDNKIRTAKNNELNKFKKLESSIQADRIEGTYEGYVIKYDWSGKHAVSSATLKLVLHYQDGILSGTWTEEMATPTAIQAVLTPTNLLFRNTAYKRRDHYNQIFPVTYNFDDAKLQWITQGDSVLLAGSIQMFAPVRNEPQKPVYISLVRKASDSTNLEHIAFTSENGSGPLSFNSFAGYPNPFNTSITADFKLEKGAQVQVQLLSLDGKLVYNNRAGYLAPGNYRLPVRPNALKPGNYLLRLMAGTGFKTIKVIKF